MNNADRAAALFQEGCCCSQAILTVFGVQFHLDAETAMRLAAGFGGGLGRLGGVCGAVSGAVMVLGLKFGNAAASDQEGKEAAYAHVREFARRFQTRHGSLICRDLLDCDISSPEGLATAKRYGLFSTVCAPLVRNAAMMLDDMLNNAPAEKRSVTACRPEGD